MDAILIYLIASVGAAGLFCLAPRSARPRRLTAAGGIVGAAALALLLAFIALRFGDGGALGGLFYLFSFIAVIAAARVVTHHKPVYSALYFVLVILAVAGLLLLLSAEFLAFALIIIYAGAILVTYIFVIMLAQQSDVALYDRMARDPWAAILVGFVLTATIAAKLATTPGGDGATAVVAGARVINTSESSSQSPSQPLGNTRAMGMVLLTDYVVTLEVAGVLLLAAMVGAIVLARRPLAHDVTRTPGPPPGQAGRRVPPF